MRILFQLKFDLIFFFLNHSFLQAFISSLNDTNGMHWPCQAAPILCSPEGAQHLVEEACRPQAAQRAVPSRDSADGGPRGIRGLEEDQVNQHG